MIKPSYEKRVHQDPENWNMLKNLESMGIYSDTSSSAKEENAFLQKKIHGKLYLILEHIGLSGFEVEG